MTISEELLLEFDQEMASTRKILERVPEDKWMWKPHERSSTLGKLANHVAIMPAFPALIISKRGAKPPDAASKAELLTSFDNNVAAGRAALAGVSDDQLAEKIMVTPALAKPLFSVLRGRVMNHLIHHRGQMSVYLRLLEVPVPGMYGPTADEK